MLTPATTLDLRAEIDRNIESASPAQAASLLAELWRKEPKPSSATFVCARFEKLRGSLPLILHRVAILRSFTVEPLVPLLRADAFCWGIDLEVKLGDFNAYAQEILDPSSSLYGFNPNTVLLAARTADLAPDLWSNFASLSPEEVERAAERVTSSFANWIRAFREHSTAALVVHNLEQPILPSTGIMDAQSGSGQGEAIGKMNRELRRIVAEHRSLYLLDYDGLVARYGRATWIDEQKYLSARLPMAAENLIHLSREWMRFLAPLSGRIAKVLVTDLDNTLWGGVIGEDGLTGIKLGPEYPGAAYLALQRAMRDLSQRGILLAICSKNNPDDASEVLQNHPEMLLRPKDFAATRISWNDKAQGLREIAAELNVGTDSLAFLDDNPVEREQMRSAMPEVMVIELPEKPLAFARTLREYPAFERLSISAEDQHRNTMYAEQKAREQVQESFQSKEDFYRFLNQEVEVARVVPGTLARIAQLTQKTNQFNLTTRRYSEQQIADMAQRPGWEIYSVRVRDRFGDQGLVGVAITHIEGRSCEIDTFLLSCRVIGRTVETAFLSEVSRCAAENGANRLQGWFLPTKKNAPAKNFYPAHGFQMEKETAEGSCWTFDLEGDKIACPDWVTLKVVNGASN